MYMYKNVTTRGEPHTSRTIRTVSLNHDITYPVRSERREVASSTYFKIKKKK